MSKECELYDRECINCGECEFCDLDPKKKCDNCGKCFINEGDYRTLDVLKYIDNKDNKKQ
jgi:hypothetical protein